MSDIDQQQNQKPWIWLSLATLLITAYVAAGLPLLDDAFISFRYGLNLVAGRGLVFNPGEVVEGYSNYLWTIMAAGWIALGLNPASVAQVLGLLFACGTAALVLLLLKDDKPLAAAGAVFCLCLNPIFIRQATNGLETSLFTFLITLGFYLGQRKLIPAAAIVFGISALTRFEGALFFAVWWLTLVVKKDERENKISRLFGAALIFGLIFAPYFIWRWSYFDQFLPNTFYAKKAPLLLDLRTGWTYLGELFMAYPFLLLAWRRRHNLLEPKLLAFTVFCCYTLWVGGDSFDNFRFIAPILPLGLVLVFENIWRRNSGLRLLLVIFVCGWSVFSFYRMETPDDKNERLVAEAISQLARPGQSLATAMIGRIGYRNPKLIIVDTVGLTDPVIARRPADPDTLVKGHQKYDAKRVLNKNPDYFFPIGEIELTELEGRFTFTGFKFDSDIIEHPSFAERYQLLWFAAEGRRFYYFARRDQPPVIK